MSQVQIVAANTAEHMAASEALREKVLRAPWGMELEADEHPPAENLVGLIENRVVATGRLFIDVDCRAQIRSMATEPHYRGHGVGQRMLAALEQRARGRGCSKMWAHARTHALPFYTQAGFVDIGDGPTLGGQITHRVVERPIDHDDYRPWNLALRPARANDGPALSKLIFACLAEFGMTPERDGIDRDLEAIVETYAGGAFWVAENAQGHIEASVGMLPMGNHAYELRRMYLAQPYRGSGLGRALLGTALNWAHMQSARYVELETDSALKAALHLYRWAGFTPVCAQLETQRCDQRLGLRLR